MPRGLERWFGGGGFHFITCSCYERRKLFGSAPPRDTFLEIFEEVREKFRFVVAGYVVMPEHFHLLVSEPARGTTSYMMQILKQRVSHRLLGGLNLPTFWIPRYHDFNVFSYRKYVEKLRYIHRNPVRRGLVTKPEDWLWSSYRFYYLGEGGPVKIEV